MKKAGGKICPKCRSKLKKKAIVYQKDLFPDSPIKEIDVTGKSPRELHSYGVSGVAMKSKNTKVSEFFKNTTGLSLVEKRLVCENCGFFTEDND